MNTYKIKYVFGNNIYVKYVKTENIREAMVKFYISVPCTDVLSVEKVNETPKVEVS